MERNTKSQLIQETVRDWVDTTDPARLKKKVSRWVGRDSSSPDEI